MNELLEKRRPAVGPGDGGMFGAGEPRTTSYAPIVLHTARHVKQLRDQAAQLEGYHRALAVWHRERAARWLEAAHLSPWHASHFFGHIDAAAWHEKLAARHAQVCGALEGVNDGDA